MGGLPMYERPPGSLVGGISSNLSAPKAMSVYIGYSLSTLAHLQPSRRQPVS
jgi:hypothetical protein